MNSMSSPPAPSYILHFFEVLAWRTFEVSAVRCATLSSARCSEATASNLFAMIDGRLATPPTACAALPGITRAVVIELAAGLGLTVDDRPFDLARFKFATEAFLTSSLRGIAPLVRLDGYPIGVGKPGSVTRQVMTAYSELVTRECGA